MTAKEEAEKLVQEMIDTYDITSDFVYDSSAKLCAWIAAERILKEVSESADNEVKSMRIIYWKKVKQEIEKL
jgi:hypothetical protein